MSSLLDKNAEEDFKDSNKSIDPIVEAVVKKFRDRSNVGFKKYGTTLEDNNTDDFLNHLQEELMDAVNYIEKLKSINKK
jgi:hypothetical protein